jgi:hypothetical protein
MPKPQTLLLVGLAALLLVVVYAVSRPKPAAPATGDISLSTAAGLLAYL